MATILIVDDESAPLQVMEEAVRDGGHRPIPVRNVEAAMKVLQRGGVDLIISDYRMPGTTGLEFLQLLEEEGIETGLIMVTGYASIEHAVTAIKAGALDYITKPIRAAQLQLAIDQALELQRLQSENAQLRREVVELRSGREIIGESESLSRVLETIRTVAPSRAAVLLEGESGTGKELLARAVHNLSDRGDGPFISVNCAALPETLVESLLFGHEKGAFTGAVQTVKGSFERAHRGTLLLDEISEMRVDLQAKLLRVLQEQEFERVGGTTPIRVDVRVVATTNRDLPTEIAEGRFREDLYYRLSVVPLRVPPLRERREDIPKLAVHFARRIAADLGKPLRSVSPKALAFLQEYSWPGNVRELSHSVERAVILAPGEVLEPQDFESARFGLSVPRGGAGPGSAEIPSPSRRGRNGEDGDGTGNDALPVVLETLNLADTEEILIRRALESTGDNRTRAADLLGINVRTLRSKLNRPD
ncbi:MAG: sigma-54-dependent Fis family transcriptional regulator [Gemmatimonadales bacterium]|nr:MAG: sigma-54-dependent Fis family transcriptional regulator [Gemmatimonadales bacterium]